MIALEDAFLKCESANEVHVRVEHCWVGSEDDVNEGG